MPELKQDIWSRWLLDRRFGGDPRRMQTVLEFLNPVRDRVLRHANLGEGQTLLDVGCGDGLIAFGALEGTKTSRVIFSDISQDLLTHTRSLAREMHVLDRCVFLCASADDLSPLPDSSTDAVTASSVLIHVQAKQKAFDEFYRVLGPGGRLSIFEPINRFAYPEPAHLFDGYDVSPVQALAHKVNAVYLRLQPVETDPMLDFDERDLLALAEKAGFRKAQLELQIEIAPCSENVGWDTFLRIAGNPRIPTLEEAMREALTPGETESFTTHLRPLVERGKGVRRSAVAYLWAVKS
ncbi:MAG: methyltransferase domain-containing protein [Anaerolineae bacterium]